MSMFVLSVKMVVVFKIILFYCNFDGCGIGDGYAGCGMSDGYGFCGGCGGYDVCVGCGIYGV